MDLNLMQELHAEWLSRNFPHQPPHRPLLGIMEEVGELSHAHLKHEQGIRGMEDQDLAYVKKRDAVGDIFIYLCSYCTANNISIEDAVYEAWEEVAKRDWVTHPQNGVDK